MPVSHKKALVNFKECRTEAYGQSIEACPSCGLVVEKKGACRNRACPKCNNSQTQEWIETAKQRLPNTSYVHMVFTVPTELHYLARKNQSIFYDRLLKSVGETLQAFGKSDKWVQGRIGFLSVLHTWNSELNYFPHVHVLMMGGFLNQDGNFETVQRQHLFPERALAKRFKTVFLNSLRESFGEKIPSSFWKLAWVVYSKKSYPGTQHVVEYLGRYIKRIGIGPSRVLNVDESGVEFNHRHRLVDKKSEYRKMKVSGEEFLRRYLQHILPKGFVRIRYMGLLHPYWAKELEKIRKEFETEEVEVAEPEVKKEGICEVCQVPLVPILKIDAWFLIKKNGGRKFYIYKGNPERGKKEDEAVLQTKMNLKMRKRRKENRKKENNPHNNLVKLTNFIRHAACEAQPSRRHREARRFPPSAFA
jgi:hypothetical protein